MVPAETVLTDIKGASGLPKWFSAAYEALRGIEAGSIDMILPDGRRFRVQGREPGPEAELSLKHPGLFARVAREGELGFSEAYLDGWWDTPDLQKLLDVLLSRTDWVRRTHPAAVLAGIYRRIWHWTRSNTRTQAKRNISYHYDLGNDFYGKWLDPTMTYSSAIFDDPAEELSRAQTRKYGRMCDTAGAAPDRHLLEIGCGWGGFAEFAARERGAKVTALTISRRQQEFAQKRVFEAGLAERVAIELRDYRDEAGKYDGIASIEMFEAVGEKYWPVFFEGIRERLKPGAQAALQVITIQDAMFNKYRKTVDFVQKYIFPGGMLPSVGELDRQITRAGLQRGEYFGFGQSYSQTLRQWHGAFNEAWDDIHAMGYDDRFRRMWNLYLTSCAATFQSGATDVVQFGLRRAT